MAPALTVCKHFKRLYFKRVKGKLTFQYNIDTPLELAGLSTYGRFLRFAADFRKKEGYSFAFRSQTIEGEEFIELRLNDACEFMSRKDYIDNWQSEMHETFCFWDFNEWKQNLELACFTVSSESKAYVNDWIVENRLKGKVELYKKENGQVFKIAYPVTNMILLGEKK